ncbi:MAG TPA: hypothetical protein VI479_04260 [Blastocatellia bacterium]
MTKNFCKQCGSALTKTGAKFCTTCGVIVDGAESVDLSNQETVALPGEQKNQTDFATEVIPAIAPLSLPGEERDQTAFATEVIPAIAPLSLPGEESGQTSFATEVIPAITPPAFKTEEIQQVVITERAEERATEVIKAIPTPPVIQRLNKPEEPAPAIQPSVQQEVAPSVEKSAGRKKLALAAALGVVALVVVVAASIFFINSRKAPEVQAENRPAENAAPSTPAPPIVQAPNQQDSPQPDQPSNQQPNQKIGQPSGAGAKNQAQSQTRSQPDTSIIDIDIKPPTTRNDATSKPQQEAAAKPAQAPTGTSAVEHQKQGADYLNKRLYQEALREFDFVRKLDPGNKDVYYLIGSAYNGMNQLERALEAYRQCTSGTYVIVAQNAVKNLEKKLKISVR